MMPAKSPNYTTSDDPKTESDKPETLPANNNAAAVAQNSSEKDSNSEKGRGNSVVSENNKNLETRKSEEAVPSNEAVQATSSGEILSLPEYPLLPVSKGFVITAKKYLNQYEKTLNTAGITKEIKDS